MVELNGKVAVVTGASSGIGASVAKDLLTVGMVVIGLARRIELMTKFSENLPQDQKTRFHALYCDVGNEATVKAVFEEITSKYGPVYVLVNNAGCLHNGQLCRMDCNVVQDVVQVNIMGVVYCTRYAFGNRLAQIGVKNGSGSTSAAHELEGHVILMNSIFGHRVFAVPGTLPDLNAYPMSKFALTAMTEVLRQEFKELGTRIKVTSISPGLTDTEIVPEPQKLTKIKILQPEDVSRAVMFAITSPPHVLIYELTIKPLGDIF